MIWSILGAEATEQGNCSAFKGKKLPHCCEKEPVIIDLLAGAPYNKQVANCCKGGVLSSMTQDPRKYVASFQMHIGSASSNSSVFGIPERFTLGLPGYTCGEPFLVPPTKFTEDQGRRRTQALGNCKYLEFMPQGLNTHFTDFQINISFIELLSFILDSGFWILVK